MCSTTTFVYIFLERFVDKMLWKFNESSIIEVVVVTELKENYKYLFFLNINLISLGATLQQCLLILINHETHCILLNNVYWFSYPFSGFSVPV